MAFVPRVHNREVPIANRPLAYKMAREQQRKHVEKIASIKPHIDNRWGSVWNGVKETKRATYSHVRVNLKRAQLEDERAQAIEQGLVLGALCVHFLEPPPGCLPRGCRPLTAPPPRTRQARERPRQV